VKKYLLLVLVMAIILLTACVPQTVQSGGVVLRGAETVSTVAPEDLSLYTEEHIVYVTRSGEKYHEAGCSHLSKSSIPVTLGQALQEGKAPCSRCHKDDES
jgi:competence protein ComEC